MRNRDRAYLGVLVSRNGDELGLGEGVSQDAAFVGANADDVDASLVLVQRIEHNLRVKNKTISEKRANNNK